jgi:hypothetical protein
MIKQAFALLPHTSLVSLAFIPARQLLHIERHKDDDGVCDTAAVMQP